MLLARLKLEKMMEHTVNSTVFCLYRAELTVVAVLPRLATDAGPQTTTVDVRS